MTEQITSLLQKLSLYEGYSNSNSTSSNKSESQNSKKLTESTVDEDYFHIKLRRLFRSSVESSFRNVEIEINKFFQDAKIFLDWVVEQKGVAEKKSKEMMEEITDKLKDLDKIELDSFFINVPGEIILQFFDNMKSYSYPDIEEKNESLKMENCTIIVESTHSLRSAIKKKPCQIHKYHLFFTVLNEYFKKDDKYLGKFHELFFQKYFHKSPSAFNKIQLKKEKYFPFSDNFIVIVASDNSFKVFKETTNKILNGQTPLHLYEKGKKFPKIYEKGKKNYKSDDDNEIIICSSNSQRISENYNYFKYIIDEVNNDNNWACKIIYFDLYFSLIVPKCEIKEGLTSINESILSLQKDNRQLNESVGVLTEDNRQLNESVGTLSIDNKRLNESISDLRIKNNLLEESMHILQNQNNELGKKYNKIFKFLKDKFSETDLSELNEFMDLDGGKGKIQKK